MEKKLALLALACLASPAFGQVLYETSFEDPFVSGSLNGQQGWFTAEASGIPGYQVTSGRSRTGTQSVVYDTGPSIGTNQAWVDIDYRPDERFFKVLETTVYVYLERVNSNFGFSTFGLSAWGLDGASQYGLMTGVTVDAEGQAAMIDPHGNLLFGNFAARVGEWNELKLVLDYRNNVALGYVNGVLVQDTDENAISVALTRRVVLDVDLVADATALDVAWFDDYKIAAVPEPASLAVLGLGMMGLLRRRK